MEGREIVIFDKIFLTSPFHCSQVVSDQYSSIHQNSCKYDTSTVPQILLIVNNVSEIVCLELVGYDVDII